MKPHVFFGRLLMAVIVAGTAVSFAAADEVVHFTNGAEMTIRSHVVEKEMLKLDLGGNNSISFPISMVSKIVSAGQDVFLNPGYFPANQALPAVAPIPGATVADMTSRGVAAGPGSLSREGATPGRSGTRLGEAADGVGLNERYGAAATSVPRNPHDDMETAERARFDPMRTLAPGGVATIEPSGGLHQLRRPAKSMTPRAPDVAPPPPSPQPPAPAAGDPPAPGGNDSGGSDNGNQDPPPNS